MSVVASTGLALVLRSSSTKLDVESGVCSDHRHDTFENKPDTLSSFIVFN